MEEETKMDCGAVEASSIYVIPSSQGATAAANFKEPILCQEKTIVFIDRSADIKSFDAKSADGKKVDAFEKLKKTVRFYVQIKKYTTHFRNDEFFILTEHGNGKFNAIPQKTDADTALGLLKKITAETKSNADVAAYFQLDDILRQSFEIVQLLPEPLDMDNVETIRLPPYIVRLVLFVTRSNGEVFLDFADDLRRKLRNPYLYIDIFYMHEEASPTNNVQAIYEKLECLIIENGNKGFLIDVVGSSNEDWGTSTCHFLAHPFVRPLTLDIPPSTCKTALLKKTADAEHPALINL